MHQHRGECHEHCASRLPQREAMAIGLDGAALDRGGYARSSKRLPPTEGSQATSGTPCRSGNTSHEMLNPRRPCSPSRRRVTSTSAASASQCSTKSGTSPRPPRRAPTATSSRPCRPSMRVTAKSTSSTKSVRRTSGRKLPLAENCATIIPQFRVPKHFSSGGR
jgi:hypothetical protein